MSASDDETLDDCNCCDVPDPKAIHNRPGLPALRYRIGTWATFADAMRARLGEQGRQRDLTTRAPDDPSIALLDAWAVVGDILTFYQERIANEGFLRTSLDRRSVLELARAVGYELGPGVAASTYLSFIVDEALIPDAGLPTPPLIELAAGTRVQSVPGPKETPQTFETIETIEARSAWNAMKPKATQRQRLQISADRLSLERIDPANSAGSMTPSIWLAGTATNLHKGDVVLALIAAENHKIDDSITPRDGVLCLYVTKVVPDYNLKRTRVDLWQAAPVPVPLFTLPKQTVGVVDTAVLPLTPENVRLKIVDRDWLDEDLAAYLEVQTWDEDDLLKQVAEALGEDPPPVQIQAFRLRTGVFGHTAPPYAGLERAYQSSPTGTPPWNNWDDDAHPLTVWTGSDGTPYSDQAKYGNCDLFLDRVVSAVVAGGWVALANLKPGTKPAIPPPVLPGQPQISPPAPPTPFMVDRAPEKSHADFAISAKVTGVRLLDPADSFTTIDTSRKTDDDDLGQFGMRTTTIFSQSEDLDPCDAPIDEPVVGVGPTFSVVLDRMVLGLQKGRKVAWTGMPLDPVTLRRSGRSRTEILTVEYSIHSRGYTTVYFSEQLENVYKRDTVTLNANVALATHGETTTNETLGSGDGSRAHQTFVLKRAPITYVPAATASGSETTLTVRVAGVAWAEVKTLYGAGPNDRVFIAQQQPDGTTKIQFGDGIHGARLPTGRENLVATYRTGTGPAGQLGKKTITLLQTRPLGLKSAINPLRSSGAAAPEELKDARLNAPRTVRTLDRLVSLDDFDDFARGFAGIGKVQSTPLWSGEQQVVHLTVGAATGGPITSPILIDNLTAAVQGASDGRHPVLVASYTPRFFRLAATLVIDPLRDATKVLKAARVAFKAAFTYPARAFAQAVTDAEVMLVAQAVPGVIAIDIDALYHAEEAPSVVGVLPAAGARFEGGKVLPAELLLLHPAGLTLAGVAP